MRQIFLVLPLCALSLFSQSAGGEKLSIAFRDPSRPGMVKMNALFGSIEVKTHAGKEVIVETSAQERKPSRRDDGEAASGLKRLTLSSSSITLEEENNVVTVSMGHRSRGQNIVLLVPVKTSLKLSTTNGKMLSVEGVEGEMELNSTNGSIQLVDVSGSVVAHALNGKLTAKFKAVDPAKPMSFSSLNGTIDVTLPATTKANLKMQTSNGDVYSDFEVQMQPNVAKLERNEGEENRRGRNRVRMESISAGSINGGGPEYTFKNFNGNIYIRKAN